MNTNELQQELKAFIKSVNWSQKKAAEIIYYEIDEDADEQEFPKFFEKFKKSLQRESTHQEVLHNYLRILARRANDTNQDLVVPISTKNYNLSRELKNGMKKLSSDFSNKLNKKFDSDN